MLPLPFNTTTALAATASMQPYPDLQARVKLQLQQSNTTSNTYDVIVLGVGSMGAATCYYLARQGLKVLGLEQFELPHEQGSHGGQTRIIRKAYAEHPSYVPLLERAYENWKALEQATGEQVYFPTGLLYSGKPTDPFVKGVQLASALYHIPVQKLSTAECRHFFPAFALPADYETLLEPDAGFITPERSILLYAEQALLQGACIRTGVKLLNWKKHPDGIEVNTSHGSYHAKKLVITAGAWATQLIPGLSRHLTVTRQAVGWVQPKHPIDYSLGNFPCWFIEDNGREFYGFPMVPPDKMGGPAGLKLAMHAPTGEPTHPDAVNRNPQKQDEAMLLEALQRFLPSVEPSAFTIKTCLYTNSPDQHFILDFLPGSNNQVAVATGFSGHGFKFVSVVGEIMADLVIKGSSSLPIGFLNAERFG